MLYGVSPTITDTWLNLSSRGIQGTNLHHDFTSTTKEHQSAICSSKRRIPSSEKILAATILSMSFQVRSHLLQTHTVATLCQLQMAKLHITSFRLEPAVDKLIEATMLHLSSVDEVKDSELLELGRTHLEVYTPFASAEALRDHLIEFFFCSTLLRCDLLAKKVPGRAPYSQHIIIRNWT